MVKSSQLHLVLIVVATAASLKGSLAELVGCVITLGARAPSAPKRAVVRATDRVNQSKDDIIVSPSILSADFAKLGNKLTHASQDGP